MRSGLYGPCDYLLRNSGVNMGAMKLATKKSASHDERRELRRRCMSLDRRTSSRDMDIAATDLVGLKEEQICKLLAEAADQSHDDD